jgi:hypothetical protein
MKKVFGINRLCSGNSSLLINMDDIERRSSVIHPNCLVKDVTSLFSDTSRIREELDILAEKENLSKSKSIVGASYVAGLVSF